MIALQALPFLLKDFIKTEVAAINAKLKANAPHKKLVVDPSGKIQLVLEAYKDWYNHLRQPMLTTEDLKELAAKTYKLQWILKKVFPNKSGVLCV